MTVWIFQGNPRVFSVDEYLRTRRSITWTIRQEHYRDWILPGDVVYIWRSDGDTPRSGGIVAKGRTVTPPMLMDNDAPELWGETRGKPCRPACECQAR